MTAPTPFDRQSSFALFSAENPSEPHSGADLDIEFNAVKVALDETQENLALIQEDDGSLKRASVGREQLDSSITIGFESPTPWAASTVYTEAVSTVFYNSIFYTCIETHTSTVSFESDKWLLVADLSVAAALADGSVTEAKLADGAVTSDKIATIAVTTSKLATNSVSTPKVQDSAITTAKIADANITTAKIADTNVTTAKIADTAVTTAKIDASAVTTAKIADSNVTQAKVAAAAQAVFTAYPPGFLYGRVLSNNVSDAVNDIDISAGKSRDAADTLNIVGSAITKRLDATFVAGTNQGGRSSASLVDGTWHVFDIAKADGTSDVFFHTAIDPTSVLPTDYVVYRRIGSIVRSTSIRPFTQYGDEFEFVTPVVDVNGVAQGTTASLRALSVPLGLKVRAKMIASIALSGSGSAGTGQGLYISSPDQTNSAASATLGTPTVNLTITGGNATNALSVAAQTEVFTDTSAQVRVVATAPAPTQAVTIITRGWTDTRGRLAA